MNKKRVVAKSHKDETEDCEKQIRKLEKENKRLKSENKALQEALGKMDDCLVDMIKDRSVEEIVQNIKENSDAVVHKKCPNCGTNKMKKTNLGSVKILTCTSCSYRNRLNGPGLGQT